MNNINMKKTSVLVLIPIMLAFFAMGFVDLVGIAANYVKADFKLSDTLANLLPSMVFLWFFIFSVPTGLLMNKIGRKKTVLLSLIMTLPALIIPLISYSFITMLISFTFLGIGNTLMQVSLNPLIAGLVSKERMASTLTFGQFVKAIASFIAPILAAVAVTRFADWRMILFPLFLAMCLLVIVLLFITKVDELEAESKSTSFKVSFSLLGDITVLFLFFGIMAHVGLDVGLNTTAPKLLIEKLNIPLADAGYATSFYFIFRTVGCLFGSAILAKFSGRNVFLASVLMILIGVLTMFTADKTIIYVGIALFGLGNANIFSVMFSQALVCQPKYNNEVSGLMVMGIFGGAIFPLIMGVVSDTMGGQVGAVIVLLALVTYLILGVSPKIKQA
jgi:fucose permease